MLTTIIFKAMLLVAFVVSPSACESVVLDHHDAIARYLVEGEAPSNVTPMDSIMAHYSSSTIEKFQAQVVVGAPEAGSCLGELGKETTGRDLNPVYNCNAMPLGENTKYNVLGFPDIFAWLKLPASPFISGLLNPGGFDLGSTFEDLADGTIFPDGSKTTDNCIPFSESASEARAKATSGTANVTAELARKARLCEIGNGDPCCGSSSCIDLTSDDTSASFECVATCLKPGDECFSDGQCTCIGNGYNCAVDETKEDSATNPTATCQTVDDTSLGLRPICLVCNNDMFAIRFLPALFPFYPGLLTKIPGVGTPLKSRGLGKPCFMIDGIPVATFPQYDLQVTIQFVGMGVAWNDGTDEFPNMIYGTSSTTKGTSINAPTIYDGLAQIPIVVPGINFWVSINIRFIELAGHKINKSTCESGLDGPSGGTIASKIKAKLSIEMLAELYIKTSSDAGCVLLVAPVIKLKISIIPVINIGSAIGGYCRLPGDRCTPDGFFLNAKIQPSFGNLNGIAADVLSFATKEEADFGSAGMSVGFYIDKVTGVPTGGLLKTFIEAPKFMGVSLSSGQGIEFQYISNEEIERRRWTITTDIRNADGIPQARCPRYKSCKIWKPYKLVDASGAEVLDKNTGAILYPNQLICASVLEDNDPIEGVGDFNRHLLARVPEGDTAKTQFRPSPSEWHLQDFFQGYDMFVVSMRIEGLRLSVISLDELVLTLVIFGDIQPAVNPDEVYPDEASRSLACDLAAKNDGLYVYMNIEASISILMIVRFNGRLTLANVPVTQSSGVPFTADNPNKWTVDAFAEIRFLGMKASVTASGEWFYANDDTRRRLTELSGPCPDARRRRLESEHYRRALAESVELADAPVDYDVALSCDSVLDCLEDIGAFVVQALADIYNELVKGVEKLLEVAEIAFTELAKFLGNTLDYLGLGYIADAFEDLWEDIGNTFNKAVQKFDAIASDGFQFSDLAAVGLALLEGAADLLVDAGKFVLGLIGIGIGTQRGAGRKNVGVSDFGCDLFQNLVETCDFCIFGGCVGCRTAVSGDKFAEQTCVDQAARDAAEATKKKEKVERFGASKKKEEEEENKGFYTTFAEKCQNGGVNGADCPVSKPTFMVKQSVDNGGLNIGPTSMRMAGAVLQKDAAEPMQKDKTETTGLDFRPQLPQCDPTSDEFDESFLVTTEDGRTICKDVANGIESWFKTDAMTESATFAQGNTMGKNSAVSTEFLTEDLWAPPVLTFGNAGPLPGGSFRYELELECTDDAILQNGMATTNRLFQNLKMQQLALASPGVSVQLDENLEGSATTGNWRTLGVKQSCLVDVTTMAYTVTDRTDKVSNALEYEFRVTVVPPQLDLNGPVEINLGCNPGDLNPFTNSTILGEPPSESGGCLSESFNLLIFEDSISTSLSSDKCSGINISRTWSLRPPTQAEGTEIEDLGNADCAADLAALAEPVTQVINIDCDDENEEPPKMIPEKCLASPLRFAGFEVLTNGLARIDILGDGLASLFRDEALFDESGMPARVVFANTTEPIANDNTIDEPSIANIFARGDTNPDANSVIEPKLKGKYIVEGSFVTFDGNNHTALLEQTFYVDYKNNAIRHREIVPDVLQEYTDLCHESIIGFQVKVEKPYYDKNAMKGGKGKKQYELHYLCFEAVCGEKLASTVPVRRRLDNHIEELEDMKERTKISSRPSREEIRAKLEHGPFIEKYELENEKRLFNLRAASAARRA